jgi:hypothetical protein
MSQGTGGRVAGAWLGVGTGLGSKPRIQNMYLSIPFPNDLSVDASLFDPSIEELISNHVPHIARSAVRFINTRGVTIVTT